MLPAAGTPPVEWAIAEGLVDYDEAVGAMEARAAAIAEAEAELASLDMAEEAPEKAAESSLSDEDEAAHLAELAEVGVESVFVEFPGTSHEWQTWRKSLYDFAARLFRD